MIDAMYREAFRDMDPQTGMFPANWCCTACGRQLNADGNHPAELYAGTFTSLCYSCEKLPGFVARTLRDGCQVWSFPPSCPSWRRDREEHFYYPGCTTCPGPDGLQGYRGGPGFTWQHTVHGSRMRRHCPECTRRHREEPLRALYCRTSERMWQRANERFATAVKAARRKLRPGRGVPLPDEVVEEIKAPLLADFERQMGLLETWSKRRNVFGRQQ